MTLDWSQLLGADGPGGCSSPTCRTTSPRRWCADLLDGVPEIARMLVMVQREVGERLAAGAGLGGLRRGQREGGVLGDGPDRRRRAGRRCSCPGRTSSRRWSRSSATSRPTSPPERRCSSSCARRSGSAARCCAARSPGVVDADAFAAAGVAQTARPEELGVDDWVPPDQGRRAGVTDVIELLAPGQADADRCASSASRDDGYHLLDAEMVTLDLADELTIDPAGDGITVERAVRRRRADRRDATSSRGRWRSSGARPRVHIDKRIPHGGGLGGGSADAAAVLRWAGVTDLGVAAAARRRRAVLPRRRPGPGARHRRDRRAAAATEPMDVTLVVPPLHVSTPAVYRAWDELGGPTGDGPERPRTGGRRRRAGAGRAGATASASWPAWRRCWPAAGRRGSCRAERDDALAALRSEGAAVVVARTAPAAG